MFRSKNRISKLLLVLIFLFTALFVKDGLSAEIYPDRPITIVCGWGAGGMHDTLIRLLSRTAEKELGQPIIQ
jgi:tripartite-type tricarboxylate transporter receptor subunit TctC